MKIDEFVGPEERVGHSARHGVTPNEFEQACSGECHPGSGCPGFTYRAIWVATQMWIFARRISVKQTVPRVSRLAGWHLHSIAGRLSSSRTSILTISCSIRRRRIASCRAVLRFASVRR